MNLPAAAVLALFALGITVATAESWELRVESRALRARGHGEAPRWHQPAGRSRLTLNS